MKIFTPLRAAIALAGVIALSTAAVAAAPSGSPRATRDVGSSRFLSVHCGGQRKHCSPSSSPTSAPSASASPTTGSTSEPSQSPSPSASASATPSGTAGAGWWHPGPLSSWQWELSWPVDTSRNVQVYDIDYIGSGSKSDVAQVVSTLHSQGKKAICYLETGGWENYRPDAGDYAASILGSGIDGWAGEKYVDVRALDSVTGPTGKTLHQILLARFQRCADEGFDGVETDIDDQYPANTGFGLTKSDYETFDKILAGDIHRLGMAWFLKNGINGDSFITDLEPYAEGTVNESCWTYSECGALKPFATAGKPILNAEYSGSQSSICPGALSFPMAAMEKKLSLDATVLWQCW